MLFLVDTDYETWHLLLLGMLTSFEHVFLHLLLFPTACAKPMRVRQGVLYSTVF